MRLRQEKIERGRDISLQVLAMNDGVEKTVLEKKFRRLKAFGKFLADGLFDDARPGETDERAGLGDVDVAEHGIARGVAAGRGIGEDGNKRQGDARRHRGGAADTFASCIRLMVPSIMRAPPEQEIITSGTLFAMAASIARVTFSPTTAPIDPPMKLNSIEQQMTGRPPNKPSAVTMASAMPSFLRASFNRDA